MLPEISVSLDNLLLVAMARGCFEVTEPIFPSLFFFAKVAMLFGREPLSFTSLTGAFLELSAFFLSSTPDSYKMETAVRPISYQGKGNIMSI